MKTLKLMVVVMMMVALAGTGWCASAGVSIQEEVAHVKPNMSLSLGGKFSENDSAGIVDVIVPVLGNEDGFLFVDPHATISEGIEYGMGIGLGGRKLVLDETLIVGANVYFDSLTSSNENRFNQIGAGFEALTEWVDARVNGYWPLDDAVALESSAGSTLYEEALTGFDGEVGVKVPLLDKWVETRVFAGYYSYSRDHGDDISGFKGRLEMRVLPILTLDAEVFENDELHGTQYYVGARVNIPLGGNESLFRNKKRTMKDRMTEMVIRDYGIKVRETIQAEDNADVGDADLRPVQEEVTSHEDNRDDRDRREDEDDDKEGPFQILIVDGGGDEEGGEEDENPGVFTIATGYYDEDGNWVSML